MPFEASLLPDLPQAGRLAGVELRAPGVGGSLHGAASRFGLGCQVFLPCPTVELLSTGSREETAGTHQATIGAVAEVGSCASYPTCRIGANPNPPGGRLCRLTR
jgi:hypothetical protein